MRGFVNSWAVAIIALSVVILFTTMYTIQGSLSDVDAGYAAEMVRWAGDLDNVSAEVGGQVSSSISSCTKGILADQLVGSDKIVIHDTFSSHRNRTVYYHSSLLDFNISLEKDYPPYVKFAHPGGTDKVVNCRDFQTYTFSWYKCDPDGDNVNVSLYRIFNGNQVSLGTTNKTYLSLSCDTITKDISNGDHTVTFRIVGTDGTLTSSDSVVVTLEK